MTVYIKREDAIDAVLDVYYNTPDIDLSGSDSKRQFSIFPPPMLLR